LQRINFEKNNEAAEWMPAAIFIVGLFLASSIIVSISTNGIESGIGKGEMAPDFTALAHLPGNDTADWFSFRLYEHLDMNWSGNYSEGVFTVIEFLDTDCPHCWDSSGKISSLYSQLIDYGVGGRVQFIIIAVQLPLPGHSSSIEEIVAFQEKLTHSGCLSDGADCSTRPGSPHPGVYVDDLNLEIYKKYAPRGTPHYMILKPNGIVGWDGQQDAQNEIGIELTNLICKDGGDSELCLQVNGE